MSDISLHLFPSTTIQFRFQRLINGTIGCHIGYFYLFLIGWNSKMCNAIPWSGNTDVVIVLIWVIRRYRKVKEASNFMVFQLCLKMNNDNPLKIICWNSFNLEFPVFEQYTYPKITTFYRRLTRATNSREKCTIFYTRMGLRWHTLSSGQYVVHILSKGR